MSKGKTLTEMLVANPCSTKVSRMRRGLPLRVLDLFSGCGGFSLGFKTAGFRLLGSVECDSFASKTHVCNLLPTHTPVSRDISDTDPLAYVASLWPGPPQETVDIIVGGPPCQTFARIGRAKLRSESRRESDWTERASLYSQYLRFVEKLQPMAIVFENVPDILNYGGGNIAALICEQLEELGYAASCTLLNSVFYGVPQLRERLYLIAYHRSLDRSVTWPAPTHSYRLPAGYDDIRAFARRQERGRPSQGDPLLQDLDGDRQSAEAVNVRAALEDLPSIMALAALEKGQLGRNEQRMSLEAAYPQMAAPAGSYGHLMRNWPGFEGATGVLGHVTRRLPRDFRIFAKMQPGDQYPEAYSIAEHLFSDELRRLAAAGSIYAEGSSEWTRLQKAYVPPYSPFKFPNKWRKLDADTPSRTLMAHLSHDGYSHIHYDSAQARTISVREAARLQSFPDGFRFDCCMNEAFKQIGNAVPPLVSYALAREIGLQIGMQMPPDIRSIPTPPV